MNKEFDFDQVGKRMPYLVPKGFFETIQENIRQRADEERRRKRVHRLKTYVTTALAAAAVFCGVWLLPTTETEDAPTYTSPTQLVAEGGADFMDTYIRQLTDEELNDWLEFSENDIYYELTSKNEEYEEN
ncbi:MAG: hypothetical protein IJ494_09535 [Bacteroides sp.]|nr:hypothetical protein [Bacteroides sp.]